jgi:hypothetical protein
MTKMEVVVKSSNITIEIDSYNAGNNGIALYLDGENVGYVTYEQLACIRPAGTG